MTSKELNRTQLISMISFLRGELLNFQNLVDQKYLIPNREILDLETKFIPEEDLEDSKIIMELTKFELSKEDEVEGGYDKTWM